MGGYPLVVHNAATTNLVWAPTTNILWTNISGFPQLPPVPLTSGTNASSANGYLGYLGAPTITNAPATTVAYNSYTNATTNGPGRTVEVILDPTSSTSTVRYTPGNTINANTTSRRLTNNAGTEVYTSGAFSITSLRVIGSANTNVVQIVIPASQTNLSQIILSGTNNRRVYVNRAGNGSTLTVATAPGFSGGTWRLGLSVSNSPLAINVAAGTTLTLQGGIRTDQSISVNSGTLALIAETAPSNLEFSADRILWLEDNRTP